MSLPRNAKVEVSANRPLFRGRIFDLVRQSLRLPSGLRQELELIDHPGAVAILAPRPDGRVLAVRQYRAAAGDWLWEIPAGRLERGEAPQDAARRELEEETGHRARTWRSMASFLPAPGFASEVIHLFEASGLEPVPGGGLACDADEELEVAWRRPEELIEQVPGDGKTLIGVLLFLRGSQQSTAPGPPDR